MFPAVLALFRFEFDFPVLQRFVERQRSIGVFYIEKIVAANGAKCQREYYLSLSTRGHGG